VKSLNKICICSIYWRYTWRVWHVLPGKSRTKRPRNTKIGKKVVVRPTGDNAHQFQGQKVKSQGHQAKYCWHRTCIIATERKGLRTSKLHGALSTVTASYKGLWSWVLARGRGNTVSAHATCSILVCDQLTTFWMRLFGARPAHDFVAEKIE